MTRRVGSWLVLGLGLALWLGPSPALATFPGKNGVIAALHVGTCGQGAIVTVRHDGSRRKVVTEPPCPLTHFAYGPAWSPDGERLLYFRSRFCWMCGDTEQDPPEVVTVRRDGSSERVIGHSAADEADWAPDGERLAWRFGLTVTAGPIDQQGQVEFGGAWSFGWAPGGNRLAVAENVPEASRQCSQLSIFRASTGRRLRVVVPAKIVGTCRVYAWGPDWSPDGRKLVFTRGVKRANGDVEREIYRVNRDGTELTRLTDTRTPEDDPVWSPDGRFIAYVRASGERRDIYVMRADGTRKRLVLRDAMEPAWRRVPR